MANVPILNIKNEDGEWESIPAIRGGQGYTPQRGVDYWTESDKEEVVSEATESLKPYVDNKIALETTNREQGDANLQTSIDNEATTRANADTSLQGQIDALVSKSDVVDVVGTYQELLDYDTSALGDKDVVKVLSDSTHSNARSYYRWSKTSETWSYIGSESVGYTKAETDTLLNNKADKSTTYTKTETDNLLGDKVDKEAGKGLSENNFTDEDKEKLSGIEAGAQKNEPNTVVDANYVHTDNNFTDENKEKLDGLENYDDTSVKNRLSTIEGKEAGWDAKQNAISDLETIRSGAELGRTALQEVPNTYRTSAEQDEIDEGKVDKVTGKGLIDEAPNDGREYVRKDGAWQKLFSGKTTFEDVQLLCRMGKAKDVLEIGQPFTFKRNDIDVECLVMGFIEDNKTGSIKIKDNNLSEGVIFQTTDCLYSLQFDEREAFYYTPDGLSAGDYSFVLGAHAWYSADVGKTFYFTLQNDVPAGGQLVWKQSYNATLEGGGIDVFDSGNDFSANETATMSSTPISGATSLGTIKNSFEGNFNSCQRALLGSNRWKESAMRQHLNSDAVAGSVWTPQNHWDRPPSWRTSTKGFMNGLTATLTNYIAEVEIDTYKNTVCDGGGFDTTDDKIFLPSKAELYMTKEGSDNGVAWDFYKNAIGTASPTDSATDARSKHIVNASSNTYWWERVPTVGGARNVRLVSPDGSSNYNSALSAHGVAPAFVIA